MAEPNLQIGLPIIVIQSIPVDIPWTFVAHHISQFTATDPQAQSKLGQLHSYSMAIISHRQQQSVDKNGRDRAYENGMVYRECDEHDDDIQDHNYDFHSDIHYA